MLMDYVVNFLCNLSAAELAVKWLSVEVMWHVDFVFLILAMSTWIFGLLAVAREMTSCSWMLEQLPHIDIVKFHFCPWLMSWNCSSLSIIIVYVCRRCYICRFSASSHLKTYEDFKQASTAYQSAWHSLRKEVLQDWIVTPRHYNDFTVDDCVATAPNADN